MDKTFSAVGFGNAIILQAKDTASYTATANPTTFDATIALQVSSLGATLGFNTVTTLTANGSGTYVNQTNKAVWIRLACTVFGASDSIDTTLDNSSGAATGLRFEESSIVDSNSTTKLSFTDAGVVFPGTITQTGNTAITGNVTLTGNQTQTGNLTLTGNIDVTGDITFSGAMYRGLNASLTAYAGGGQANAVALSKQTNVIGTCATALDSVKLPTPAAGVIIEVVNNGAKAAAVFPASGHTIDALSANTAYRLESGSVQRFLGVSATAWRRLNRALRFVRVSDPSAFHYSKTDLTVQTDTWTDLVLTGKVADLPPSCKVEFYLQAGDANSRSIMLRTKGNSNAAEVIRCNSIGISNAIFASSYGSVYADSSSTVQYKVDASIGGNVYANIMGYWVE